MSSIALELDVDMFDGTTHRVVCDQRDYAKWEVQPYAESNFHTKARFLAWSAMTRQGLYSLPFKKFNEDECIEANAADDPESEDEQSLDPGQTPPPGGKPSASPAKRVSRSQRS